MCLGFKTSVDPEIFKTVYLMDRSFALTFLFLITQT